MATPDSLHIVPLVDLYRHWCLWVFSLDSLDMTHPRLRVCGVCSTYPYNLFFVCSDSGTCSNISFITDLSRM